MFKRILSITVLLAIMLVFSGCQTMYGLGGDLKWTGEQVEAGAANCTIPPSDESHSK
jgi:predicted small secreted protein